MHNGWLLLAERMINTTLLILFSLTTPASQDEQGRLRS
jgi:hypothetical protein